jgi:hypothetical protein
MFPSVPQQRTFRELLGPRPGWVPIYCGVCAKRSPGRPPPMIGEGTGRTVATEIHEITMGEEDFQMSPEELLAMAKTSTKRHGELHQFVKDGPRVSIGELRAAISERMPYLNKQQLDAELEDALGRRRSDVSATRLSFTNVEFVDGRSTITCGECRVTSNLSRAELARKIDRAMELGVRVLVSPGGVDFR